MLCPTCSISSHGASTCPSCGGPIPEEETFEGQGGHYLRVLLFVSVVLFATATAIASWRTGQHFRLDLLVSSRWFWLYLVIFFLPTGIGIYFYWMLRGEQVRVTDQHIERRSRWGNEQVLWDDVTAYRKQVLPFRDTHLGGVARLSRLLTRGKLVRHIPPYAYDLFAVNRAGQRQLFRLEPGTVSDLDWLLALMREHAGEPEEP